jgi:transcriptional regulator with XRE-family HTH domain
MPRSLSRHPINEQIGHRLRQRRLLLGLSQKALGERMGLAFQQVQKYEKGMNALSADRLVQAAEMLGVTVAYFVDGLAVEPPAEQVLSMRDTRFIQRLCKLPANVRTAVEKLISKAEREAEEKPAKPRRR